MREDNARAAMGLLEGSVRRTFLSDHPVSWPGWDPTENQVIAEENYSKWVKFECLHSSLIATSSSTAFPRPRPASRFPETLELPTTSTF